MGFKENLKEEMAFQDIKPKELADRAGISVNTLRNYINGHNALPNIYSAVKIAKVLNISVEELVEGRCAANNIDKHKIRNEDNLKFFTIFASLSENNRKSVMALLNEMKSQ